MALTNGPNLGLLVNGDAGEGHYTDLMKQWRGLDALVMPVVDAYLVNTPPVSPADGYTAIIGAAPMGLWAGQGGKLTRWSTVVNAYEFFTPKNGWTAQSKNSSEVYRHTGGAWYIFYQEGTWTPSWLGATTAGTIVYSARSGVFTRLGNVVNAWLILQHTVVTSPPVGELRIAGLPFTVAADGSGSFSNNNLMSLAASTYQSSPQPLKGSSEIRIWQLGSNTDSILDSSQLRSVGAISGGVVFTI